MAINHAHHSGLLLVHDKTQKMLQLGSKTILIGRKSADIVLEDSKVSTKHAEILPIENGYLIRDLGSTNGTFVNRRKIAEVELVDQDVIEIGSSTLCYFRNILDYHGPAEELTLSTKTYPPSKTKELTTSTRTIVTPNVSFKILKGQDSGKVFQLQKAHIIVGRGDVDVPILDLDASRSHALIEILGANIFYIKDLGSTNGTFLNDQKIAHCKMKSGDKIQVGETILEFQVDSGSAEMR